MVDNRGDFDTPLGQPFSQPVSFVIIRQNHCRLAGRHSVKRSQAENSVAKENTRQVVVAKPERLLPSARTDNNLLGADLEKTVPCVSRDEIAFVKPKCSGGAENANTWTRA